MIPRDKLGSAAAGLVARYKTVPGMSDEKAIGREACGLVFANFDQLVLALEHTKTNGADFPDALIAQLCSEAGCETIMTFDEKAVRSIPKMERLT